MGILVESGGMRLLANSGKYLSPLSYSENVMIELSRWWEWMRAPGIQEWKKKQSKMGRHGRMQWRNRKNGVESIVGNGKIHHNVEDTEEKRPLLRKCS